MMQQSDWQQSMWGGGQTPPPVPPMPPVYQPAPQPNPPKGKGWIVALVAVVLFFVLIIFSVASCTNMVNSSMDSLYSLGGYTEDTATHGNTVGIIDLNGTIQYDGTVCSPEGLRHQLEIAESNPDIKAVVLRVNSGGGTATAGEEMATYIRQFSKPVVVSSASINASAAYEISSQADYIYTAKTTAIGAIGTVMQITDLSGLMEKLGISVDNITSADSKDSSYGTRPLTQEEIAYYQKQVDQINQTFVENVAEGRSMSVEQIQSLATGLTFTGIEAVENGLADEIGTLEDAVDKAMELSDIESADTMYLRPSTGGLSVLDLLRQDSSSDVDKLLDNARADSAAK